jgi:hypothetical protein
MPISAVDIGIDTYQTTASTSNLSWGGERYCFTAAAAFRRAWLLLMAFEIFLRAAALMLRRVYRLVRVFVLGVGGRVIGSFLHAGVVDFAALRFLRRFWLFRLPVLGWRAPGAGCSA